MCMCMYMCVCMSMSMSMSMSMCMGMCMCVRWCKMLQIHILGIAMATGRVQRSRAEFNAGGLKGRIIQ